MLTLFSKYRYNYGIATAVFVAVFNALLMLGLVAKTAVSVGEWIFALAAIIGGMSYAGIRDTAVRLVYAGESPKFYRSEQDIQSLKRYATGWRQVAFFLARPLYGAFILVALFVALHVLLQCLWPSALLPLTALVLLVFYPITFGCLVCFIAPLFVAWRDEQIIAKLKLSIDNCCVAQLRRKLATEDMLITLLITTALVLPVRHSAEFAPSLGYSSSEFLVAALILVTLVMSLCLLSAWRSRLYSCAGDLYRCKSSDLAGLSLSFAAKNGCWRRWFQYGLMLCAFTLSACLLLGLIYPATPIQMVLLILLLPVAGIFWIERNKVLTENFYQASQVVTEFPLGTFSHAVHARMHEK